MRKIAVFGKPGSGKSTLSKKLAQSTGIELYALDSILYKANGELLDRKTYVQQHDNILCLDNWIIDGLGPLGSFNKRLEAADILIYIDLPYITSYWFVTKRLLKGLFVKPQGWPAGSSIIKGSWQSYQTLKLCPQFWNISFEQKLKTLSVNKKLYIIRSLSELKGFVK